MKMISENEENELRERIKNLELRRNEKIGNEYLRIIKDCSGDAAEKAFREKAEQANWSDTVVALLKLEVDMLLPIAVEGNPENTLLLAFKRKYPAYVTFSTREKDIIDLTFSAPIPDEIMNLNEWSLKFHEAAADFLILTEKTFPDEFSIQFYTQHPENGLFMYCWWD